MGICALLFAVVAAGGGVFLDIFEASKDSGSAFTIGVGVLLVLLSAICLSSLMIVQPNEAKVVTFFGTYMGSVLESGLWMVLPLTNQNEYFVESAQFQ